VKVGCTGSRQFLVAEDLPHAFCFWWAVGNSGERDRDRDRRHTHLEFSEFLGFRERHYGSSVEIGVSAGAGVSGFDSHCGVCGVSLGAAGFDFRKGI